MLPRATYHIISYEFFFYFFSGEDQKKKKVREDETVTWLRLMERGKGI